MRKVILAGLVLCAAATAAWADDTPNAKDNPGLGRILFLTPAQQEAGYKASEKTTPVLNIAHGAHAFPPPPAPGPTASST